MFGIGRFIAQFGAENGNHGGAHVGKIVKGIGYNGDASGIGAYAQFSQAQQDITNNTQYTADNAIAFTNFFIGYFLIIGDSMLNNGFYHPVHLIFQFLYVRGYRE